MQDFQTSSCCTNRHPKRALFSKIPKFELGQANWDKKCRGIIDIFCQTADHPSWF